jgi:hypothetical protein
MDQIFPLIQRKESGLTGQAIKWKAPLPNHTFILPHKLRVFSVLVLCTQVNMMFVMLL